MWYGNLNIVLGHFESLIWEQKGSRIQTHKGMLFIRTEIFFGIT